MTPKTKTATAEPMSRAPHQSMGVASGSLDDGMVSANTNRSAAATTKAQKMIRHGPYWVSIAVPMKPTIALDAHTPAQMLIALLRSSFGYAAVSNGGWRAVSLRRRLLWHPAR